MPLALETDTHTPFYAHDGLPTPRRYWSVVAIWLAMSMSVLDGAIANVALPTIARQMHASAASSIWVVNAYQLAVTTVLLPLAALGDRLGYRRIYIGGLAVFTAASLACALSRSLEALTLARMVQGLGAAGIMSVNAALVRFTYPHSALGRGIGRNAVVISVSAAMGPTIASAILGVASWEWLFAVNVPIGLLAVAIGLRALPRTEGSGRSFDALAAILNAVALGCLILGAESVARDGLRSGLPILGVAVAAGFVLVRRELGRPAPLVPLDLLRIPIFGLSIATSVVSFMAQMVAYISLPFHFVDTMGRSVVEAGLLMSPWPLATSISAPFAGRLADRHRVGALGGIGLGILTIGLVLLATLPRSASDLDIVWRMAICGFGFGFFQTPNNRAMVGSAPLHRSGAAGGMLATARLLGQTTGAMVTAVYFHLAGSRATTLALATAAAIAGLAMVVSLLRLRLPRRPRPEPPDHIGHVPAGP